MRRTTNPRVRTIALLTMMATALALHVTPHRVTARTQKAGGLRSCKPDGRPRQDWSARLLKWQASGPNHRSRQYRAAIVRMREREIESVRKAVLLTQKKHRLLARLYPASRHYQEIMLQNRARARIRGATVNVRKTIALYYDPQGAISCIVLDSLKRNLQRPRHWTRRILRLPYPDVGRMQLETLQPNTRSVSHMREATPEMQLRGLRLISGNLRRALYAMDRLIAAAYEQRDARGRWHLGL